MLLMPIQRHHEKGSAIPTHIHKIKQRMDTVEFHNTSDTFNLNMFSVYDETCLKGCQYSPASSCIQRTSLQKINKQFSCYQCCGLEEKRFST